MGLTWQRLRFNLLILVIALIASCQLIAFTSAQEAQQPWYENLPAVAMDYKVNISEANGKKTEVNNNKCFNFFVFN